VACTAEPIPISGMFADCARKSTFGVLAKVNLNPVGARKFLLEICLANAENDIAFYLYLFA
jgi:hypothetical protein